MTTFAYRDGVLVADTQTSVGNTAIGRAIKVAKRGRILAAGAGSGVYARKGLDWLRDGAVGDVDMGHKDKNADLVLFLPDGMIVEKNREGWNTVMTPFYASGSGMDFALGAMAAGATAEEAVKIACRYDVWTSEPLTILRHD